MPWYEKHTDGNRTWKPSDKYSVYQLGEFSSTGRKGIALTTTRVRAFAVFSDTGGVDANGDYDIIGGRFRHLIETTQSNSSQNALRGHLPIKSGCNIASGNYTGVRGYLEIKGTTSITGASTYASAVQAYVEHGGTTTIDASQNLSGLDCYQVGSPTATGNNSAVFVRASAAASNWKHALYATSDYGIYQSCVSGGISSTVTALTVGDTPGHGFYVTCAAPTNTYGAAGYFDVTYNGTGAGHFYGLGSWINFGTSAVTGGNIIAAQDNGLYGTVTATSSTLIFGMRMESVITGTPTILAPFSLNTNNQAITALFGIASAPAIGYVMGTPSTSTASCGTVPLFCDADGSDVRYVHIYSTTS
jgi:hypothetical protein